MHRIKAIGVVLATGAALAPLRASAEEFLQSFNTMAEVDAAFTKSSWAGDSRTHSPSNVAVNGGILELKLSGSAPGTLPVCAEIVSKKNTFFYGTYRASIKMTNQPGAVVGWFTYKGSPLNEIDVEFLTRTPKTAYFTLHHIQTGVDHATKLLAFDPSAAFHEYRFDWYAGRVEYFIDNQPMATLTKQVPDQPSALLLNHWSGNIAGWGGAAPAQDVFMYVDWAYYNSEYRAPVALFRPRPETGKDFRAASRFVRDGRQIFFLRGDGRASLTGRLLE